MPAFKCPSCRQETISLTQKYLLGWWRTTTCPQCGARVAAFPWTLMVLFFFHIWNVIWWAGLYHFNGELYYFFWMALFWVLIELANIYMMPLATLRRRTE